MAYSLKKHAQHLHDRVKADAAPSLEEFADFLVAVASATPKQLRTLNLPVVCVTRPSSPASFANETLEDLLKHPRYLAQWVSTWFPVGVDDFTQAYMECALWSTNDESDESGGVPLDENYTIEDIDANAFLGMQGDCLRFQAENAKLLARAYVEGGRGGQGGYDYDESNAGHDFWLTRNGYGVGFWDGKLPKDLGDALTKAAKAYGEVYLFVDNSLTKGKIFT